MNGPFETLALQLMRTTLVTSLAVLVVIWLLGTLRIRSPRLHRVAWLLVLVQGWLLVPFTWQVEVATSPAPIAAGSIPFEVTDGIALPVTIVSAPKVMPAEPFDPVAFLGASGFCLWLMGIGALIAAGGWRYAKIFAAGKPGELATDAQWLDEWRQVRESSTLRTPVELRTTRGLGPLVCWVPWVFLVLVPRTLWASLTRADRLAILRHELAHCERGDLWKNLAVRVLAVPQWFNPLVWLAVRRFEEAGEWACDDRVAATAGSMDYAKTLLQIADQIAPLPSGAVGMASGVLTRRVERLLHFHYPNKEVREMRGILVPVLLIVVGLLQVMRIERVAAEETEAQTPAAATPESSPAQEDKMPAYIIEPPDVITVSIAEVVHKSPRKIQPFDRLVYQYIPPKFDQTVVKSQPNSEAPESIPISIDGRGYLSLGRDCQFNANNMRLEDAKTILCTFQKIENPNGIGDFTLEFVPGAPQISGVHSLGPDGKVHFGKRYGAVNLNGLTIDEAKQRIEEHLSYYLVDPIVTVGISAYNSKKYFIITKGQGPGDNIVTAPCTGSDTVLDAIAAIDGLKGVAKVWVERRSAKDHLVKPVNYEAITKGDDTATNHSLWPGDRLFIEYRDTAASADAGANQNAVKEKTPYTNPADRYMAVPTGYTDAAPPEPLTKLPIRLRYSLDYVIDPKKSLGAMEIDKLGPLISGESSLILGMLRVLEKNELISTVDGQAVVTDVETSSAFTIRPENLARLEGMLLRRTEGANPASLQVTLRSQVKSDSVAFDLRCRLSRGADMVSVDTAFFLKEGQSCLVQIPAGRGAPDAGDAYLLITRPAEE